MFSTIGNDDRVVVRLWKTDALVVGILTPEETPGVLELPEDKIAVIKDVRTIDKDTVIVLSRDTATLLLGPLASGKTTVVLSVLEEEVVCIKDLSLWTIGKDDILIVL